MARWLLAAVVALVGLSAAIAHAGEEKPPVKDDYYELYKLLADTIDQVERNYIKEVDRRELVEAAIRGVLGKLDSYSTYISPEEVERFRMSVESEFGGIGIQITIQDGQLKVLSPLVGTPAYRAGIIAGDRILEIDGQSTDGLTLDEAVRRLKGKEGTQVTLTVLHPGRKQKETFTLTRERIHVDTVLGDRRKSDDTWDYLLDPERRIGYIRITAFSTDTARELRRALEELKSAKMRALVLDLRFNSGGLLSAAIEVADMFISQGRIVSTKGRNSPERVWNARKEGTYEGFPMAVLVNRYSASASEIVAACLQDHKRAVIVGERTWGKGSVQNVIDLEDGRSALKLTTATYWRPSGKNIHRFDDAKESDQWGVQPDEGLELKLTDSELLALMEDRRQRDIVLPKPEKPAVEIPSTTQRSAVGQPAPGAQSSQPDPGQQKDGTAEKASGTPAAESGVAGAFVDRQLQLALKHLTTELAKADSPAQPKQQRPKQD